MNGGHLRSFIQRLQQLAGGHSGAVADSELLKRWVNDRDQAVFEVLVWRHGMLVLNVCRRVLRREQDVEDAFQATFLVLMRKAGSISRRDSVGSWLHKVAYRIALQAAGRNRRHAQPPVDSEVVAPVVADDWRDIGPVLDEEVNRLPPKYRRPFISCYLEGKSTDQTAAELGCPRGTVATRLAWARDRLRTRLARRGVALASAALGVLLGRRAATASVEPPLVADTVRTAAQWGQGATLAGSAARAAVLARAVLGQMQLARLKVAALVVVLVGILGTATTALTYRASSGPPAGGRAVPTQLPSNQPWLVGDIVTISPDGRQLTVAEYDKPERLHLVQLTDATLSRYQVLAPDEARPGVGYRVVVWAEPTARERATAIFFRGGRAAPGPELAGTLSGVAPDGQSVTLTPTPRRGLPVPEPFVLGITGTTEVKFMAVGAGQAQLVPGRFHAEAWLESGGPGAPRAARLRLRPIPLAPPLVGEATYRAVVQGYVADRRLLTLRFRNDPRPAFDVQLAQETTVIFNEVGPGAARITEGMEAAVWCADAARQKTTWVVLHPPDPRPAFSGRVVGFSTDQRRLTIERSEGKKTWRVDVLLEEKTSVVYRKVALDGARPTVGYFAQVWFKEKEPSKVDEVWLTDEALP